MKTNSSGTGDTGYKTGMLVMLVMLVMVVMLVMLVMLVMRMTIMNMSRWAVIKWAARASSEQGATSMTEVKEQFDYLDNIEEQFDNMLKTSLHPETIQYHPKPFISISDVSSLNKPSTEMLKCTDGYSTAVLPVDSMDGMEHRLGWAG